MWLTGPVAPRHLGSSQTRARTRVPSIGRQILNHCATREAPTFIFRDYPKEVTVWDTVIFEHVEYIHISRPNQCPVMLWQTNMSKHNKNLPNNFLLEFHLKFWGLLIPNISFISIILRYSQNISPSRQCAPPAPSCPFNSELHMVLLREYIYSVDPQSRITYLQIHLLTKIYS